MKQPDSIEIVLIGAFAVFLYIMYRYMRFGSPFMWLPGAKKKYKAHLSARRTEIIERRRAGK